MPHELQSFAHREDVATTLPYLLYLPRDYHTDPDRRWPLVMFLHGMGERGTDAADLTRHGLAKHVVNGDDYPFVMVAPQCPLETWWDMHYSALMALLDATIAEQRIDPAKVYLTGLSMGGFATWGLASRHPDRFAAIAPVCGGLSHWRDFDVAIAALKTMPVWAFHGAQDATVPLWQSERLVGALKQAGNDVRFTVYPDAYHDSWTATYANPELYTWMLEHAL